MPIIKFADANCLACQSYVKSIHFRFFKWGFPPFKDGFDTVYTVGTGFSATAMTLGMLCKRVASGVVTGVYEAKGTFTASGDPSTDTTNWRHAGLTATAGEANFWWNCDPVMKYAIRARWLVGTGWKVPEGLGFARLETGTICRVDGGLRRMKVQGGFGVAVADDDYWEDYAGTDREDCDYDFSRFCVLGFEVGDLVERDNAGTLSFYRCKVPVDHAGSADGTGDPSTDTTHWEVYEGKRSAWLDFAAPALDFSSPFEHYTPTTRYTTWKETTEVFLDAELCDSWVREITRDNLTGRLSFTTDETVGLGNVTITLPDPPDPGNPARPEVPPEPEDPPVPDDVNTYVDIGAAFAEEQNLKRVDSITIAAPVYPALAPSSVGYTAVDAIYPSSPESLYQAWTTYTPIHASSGTVSMELKTLTLGATEVVFEWEGTIPWYYNIEVSRQYQAEWRFIPYAYTMWYGESTITGGPTAVNGTLKVRQTVELLTEYTQAAAVDEAIAQLDDLSFPAGINSYIGASTGAWQDGVVGAALLDNHGTMCSAEHVGVECALDAAWPYYRNLGEEPHPVPSGFTDARLVENLIEVQKAAYWMVRRHWTVVTPVGGSATVAEYQAGCNHVSQSFWPVDDALKTFEVATSDPSA